MNFKNLFIIAFIFLVPIFAYVILSKSDVSYASKTAGANKPQIIKFTSQMCLDCKKLEKVLKEVYPKYSSKITLVEVHVQNEDAYTKQQVQKYGVNLVPTIVTLNSKGKKVAKIEGFVSKEKLDKIMKDLANE